jgi:TonB-dependent starch-binding outer membrane protein SusC
MKKLTIPCPDDYRGLKKMLLCMRLTSCLLLLTFLHVSAHVRSQDKLTVNVRHIGWQPFFELLQTKSNYTFLYKDNSLPRNEHFDVAVSELTVPQILDAVLRNSPLTYQLLPNRLIAITPRVTAATATAPDAPEDIRVTGRIVSSSGDPLAGATVHVKGGTAATSTDSTGHFTLMAPDDATLVISYIGYESQEIAVTARTRIDVTLTALPGSLNEVVVIGYGTARKKDLTGAVSTVNARDISGLPVAGSDQILQGKAAGVAVTQVTGAPGDGVSVIIRGQASFGSSVPLYVIDGIPTADGINEISPNDIESVSVLKDASSASIYGARAANGVVLITTKKGVNGKPRLSANGYYGVQSPAHLIPMANTAQYLNAYNAAATNDYVAGGASNRALLPLGMLDTLPNVNWQKQVLKSEPMYDAQLSIAGGSEGTKYIVSANYLDQKGMILNSGFSRFNLRTSVTSTLNKIFEVGTNLNLAYDKTRQIGSSGDGYTAPGGSNPGASVVRYALFRTPATPVKYLNGPYQGQYVDLPETVNGANVFGDGLNPVALAANTDRNFYNYTLLGDVYLQVTPIAHLKLKSDFGTNLIITDYKQFYPTWGIQRIQNSPNALDQSNTNNFNYNWTNTATYDVLMGKQSLNILAGTEIIYNDTKAISASETGFINQTSTFQYLSNGTSLTPGVGGNESNWSLSSLFARLTYQYDGKYLATFNFRRDGSSRLDPSDQWGNFFSGSAGWRIDKEAFMQNVRPISLLKLRVDYGQLGDQNALSNYGYASLVGSNGYYPFGTTPAITSTIYAKGNPNLKWQTTTMGDVGLDLGLFADAVTLTADYYRKITTNLLQAPQDPTSAGAVASPAFENNGKILNEGFEFELSYRHTLNHDWSYNVTGNLTTLHNDVEKLLNNQPIPAGRVNTNVYATSTAVGHPVGAFYMLKQEGIFQTPEDVFTHASQGAPVRPGDVKYLDVNSDGVIDQNDRVFAGSPIPNLTYALTGQVHFKQFDVSLFFQGVSGDKIYNQVAMDIVGFYRPFNITEKTANDSWHGAGTSNTRPLLSWNDATNNTQTSTRFLESGDYLKLKNVQLGYNFSSACLSKLKMRSIRFYISVQNVFTITKYTGQDPEMTTSADAASSNDGPKALNIDWGTYPAARTMTLGANVNF